MKKTLILNGPKMRGAYNITLRYIGLDEKDIKNGLSALKDITNGFSF